MNKFKIDHEFIRGKYGIEFSKDTCTMAALAGLGEEDKIKRAAC